MRLKRYVEFGLLSIGHRLYIRSMRYLYKIYVREDVNLPLDDNIVLEVCFNNKMFTTNNIDLLAKRFIANNFKLDNYTCSEKLFYINEEKTISLYNLKQKIIKIVFNEYNILHHFIPQNKKHYCIVFKSWPDDIEFIRTEIKNILGYTIEIFTIKV